MSNHISVLLNEAIRGLNINPDGIYVDLTLGRGGHSLEILKRLNKGKLIALDQDDEAIKESKIRLEKYQDKLTIVRDNFVNIPKVLNDLGINHVDGVLMDLGVSSPQFDEGARGFSYRYDAVLDMRMDLRNPLTAKQVVNTYSLDALTKVFKEYGEEKFAYSIAKAIVKAREKQEVNTTFELVELVKLAKPAKELKKVGHPAKQVFQALRIEVNNELHVLEETIKKVLPLLNHKGRLAVITFHSLEDRIVKKAFVEASVVVGDRLNIPTKNVTKEYTLVTRHPLIPSESEVNINHRAKSAKLRIIERK